MYMLYILGYEPPKQYKTQKQAINAMNIFIKEDKKFSSYKLVLVKHSNLHKELKIGNRQSHSTYSEYCIVKQ